MNYNGVISFRALTPWRRRLGDAKRGLTGWRLGREALRLTHSSSWPVQSGLLSEPPMLAVEPDFRDPGRSADWETSSAQLRRRVRKAS